MERLTIRAANPESGHAMLAALSGFRAEMLQDADGCEVIVTLGNGDGEIAAVLSTLERFVTERSSGPARVELNGRPYAMHPAPDTE
jgi:hypothetical protein